MRVTSSMLRGYSRVNPFLYSSTNSRRTTSKTQQTGNILNTAKSRAYSNVSGVKSYAVLGANAEKLRDTASILSSSGSNNVFAYSRRTDSKDEILNQAKSLVNAYNDTVNGMKNSTSSTDKIYRRMLENATDTYGKNLSDAGITVNSDKTLSIDEGKFKSADIDTLERALGSKSGFTERMSYVSDNIARTAAVNTGNMTGRYSSYNSLAGLYGGSSGAYTNSVYDAYNYLSSFMGSRFGLF